jgi:hypothetical protein
MEKQNGGGVHCVNCVNVSKTEEGISFATRISSQSTANCNVRAIWMWPLRHGIDEGHGVTRNSRPSPASSRHWDFGCPQRDPCRLDQRLTRPRPTPVRPMTTHCSGLRNAFRAGAVRRAGELLKEINGKGNNQHSGGTPTKLTQREAAEQAGLSKDQQVTAACRQCAG